ncbi:hypothetical protein QE152_g6732 [Popillia japonica]|uniref:Uncharacterized protein n=1 Tax=Popillia japonica TaxID=7064 RepID=A0AAW1MHI1_POPJA
MKPKADLCDVCQQNSLMLQRVLQEWDPAKLQMAVTHLDCENVNVNSTNNLARCVKDLMLLSAKFITTSSESQKRDFVTPKPNESKLNKKSSEATASKIHLSQKSKKKSEMTAQKKKKIEVKAPQKEKIEVAKRKKIEASDHTIPKK